MKIWISLLTIAVLGALYGGVFLVGANAQRRAQAFSHSTPAHKNGKYADCSVCHQLPTNNWASPRRDKLEPFPDVATFPNPHRSGAGNVCFACHTNDAFSNGGVFCGTCHTVPSMKAKAVLAFPDRRRGRQFNTIFPHNIHQDLIAKNQKPADVAVAHFVPVSFSRMEASPAEAQYNCAVCHQTSAQIPKYGPRKLPLLKPLASVVADTFERPVAAAFFKDSPEGHASCFNCHYRYQYLPAGKQTCSGCHELTKPYAERKELERYSIKFDHERQGHVEKDCASCHVRITQNSDVRSLKDADVPISACWSCHATQEADRSRRILTIEIESRDASVEQKQTPFQCTYCHTSAIGRFDVPATHRKP